MTSESQIRATFEDTFNFQEKYRKKLEVLEKENRCLKDNVERDEMFEIHSRSTLGLGDIEVKIKLPDNMIFNIVNLEQFITLIFYYDKNIVDKSFFLQFESKVCPNDIEIKFIWHQIRVQLFKIFPIAKSTALRISKEQTRLGPSDAGLV